MRRALSRAILFFDRVSPTPLRRGRRAGERQPPLSPVHSESMSKLGAFGADLEGALERVNVPSYVIDASGVIRWLNPAAMKLVGDVRGRQFTSVVAADDSRYAREVFARKIAGTATATDAEVALLDAQGKRVTVEVSSAALLQGGHVIGVFGQITHQTDESLQPTHPALTPRQTEILRLLMHGRSTVQIAEELHLSRETVRNHIRHLLRALGVHSRLEAVALARHEHLAAS
jgi:PAS domain S-box-containing protein